VRISVFTPTNNPRFLQDAYNSIINQNYQNWEWVILVNSDALSQLPEIKEKFKDPRIRVIGFTRPVKGIGQLKGMCCELSTGDILLELDHDDYLRGADVFDKLVEKFYNESVSVVYSNFIQINEDGSLNKDIFSVAHGWKYRVLDTGELEFISFDPHPHNVAYLWYAPNHLRAFRRKDYERVGGYNQDLKVCDDADLLCRLYSYGRFEKIDEPLYAQRIHPNQTQKLWSDEIQVKIHEIYEKYISEMALTWAERQGLYALDFGGAHRSAPGFRTVDIHGRVDYKADLTKDFIWEPSSVGVIRAVDFLEHIPDKIKIIKEIYKVLAHGGMLLSMTPSTDGRGAFQDPTHVAFYNENSFWYYTRKAQNNFVRNLNVRFQESRLKTYYPTPTHKEARIKYTQANLIAIKNNLRDFGGLLLI
jgi:glycosyltransferase involved in cell wall biosynthesis